VHAERHKLLGAVLFNVQGMSVREINVNATHLKMPLDRIQPGNYMLLLRTESGNFYRSVVIAE
jgi:hypothetical protein